MSTRMPESKPAVSESRGFLPNRYEWQEAAIKILDAKHGAQVRNAYTATGEIWDAHVLPLIEAAERETRERCAPKWISVEERLPEVNDVKTWCHFTTHAGAEHHTAALEYCDGQFYGRDLQTRAVLHWMPLPAAPEKGGV